MISGLPEVINVLTNRDLNLLCRILEMRKREVARLEERKERYAERFKARRFLPRADFPKKLEVKI